MISEAIERLRSRIASKPLKKSGEPGSPDLQSLASKVTTLLDSGSVLPETDKVKEWAVSQGVSDSEAGSFAEDVINAYFDDSDDEDEEVNKSELGSEKDNDEEEEEGEDKESKEKKKKEKEKKKKEEEEKEKEIEKAKLEFFKEFKNTLEILKSGQETLAAAIEHLLDRAEETEELSNSVQKLKSEIGTLAVNPKTEKNPVTKSSPNGSSGVISGIVSGADREKVSNQIIKGIELGKCQLEDVAYFESTWKLSDRAQAFLNEYKEVLKSGSTQL
ncbi:hypothetical protein LFX25_20655 [Leptospira sp. FAT2]|uniref:hypothetical protein n=1 Tax=Leptospira sanjuanensis TaxID=2879643 RepID=UPI001EE8AAD5|nr:hypothetical protein [Leptospira sanjuanensis]MCG6195657.1 hypothetical protein [Leptospira sanjuanensis]